MFFFHPEAQGVGACAALEYTRAQFHTCSAIQPTSPSGIFHLSWCSFSLSHTLRRQSQLATFSLELKSIRCVVSVEQKRDKLRQSNDKNPFIRTHMHGDESLAFSPRVTKSFTESAAVLTEKKLNSGTERKSKRDLFQLVSAGSRFICRNRCENNYSSRGNFSSTETIKLSVLGSLLFTIHESFRTTKDSTLNMSTVQLSTK